MAYRQPRVPQYQGGENGAKNLSRALALFLKDFSLAAWAANGRRKREIEALERRVQALEDGIKDETAHSAGQE